MVEWICGGYGVCFARLFARTSFLLTRLYFGLLVGISPAQIAYILLLRLLGVRRRTFGITAKSASRGFCCNVPSRTLTLRNPLGEKRGWAICFSTQFYPTPTFRARSTDCEMFPGRNFETLPGSYLR